MIVIIFFTELFILYYCIHKTAIRFTKMKKKPAFNMLVVSWGVLFFLLCSSTYANPQDKGKTTGLNDTVQVNSKKWYHLQSRQLSVSADTISTMKTWVKEIGASLKSVLPKEISNAGHRLDSTGMVMMQNDTISNTWWHRVKYKFKALAEDENKNNKTWLSMIAPVAGLVVIAYIVYVFLKLFVFRKKID